MKGAACLDISAVHGNRARGSELVGDRGLGECVRKPLGVDAWMACFEDSRELREGAIYSVVGLVRIVVGNTKECPLVSGECVDYPGDFDEVGLVVPAERVELTCNK